METDTEMGPLNNFKQLEIIEKNLKKKQLIKVEKLDVEVRGIISLTKVIIFLQQLLNVKIIIYLLQKMSFLDQFYLL